MWNIIEVDFVLGPFLFAKRNGPNAKKEKSNANNKSQKQKENEKYTLHNISNSIITIIPNMLHRIHPRKRTSSVSI